MKAMNYEILAETDPISLRDSFFKRLLKYLHRVLNPEDRPMIAVFDFGVMWGILWTFVTLWLSLMAINQPGKTGLADVMKYFELIYPGFKAPEQNVVFSIPDILANAGIAGILGFAYGFLFGFVIAYAYNSSRQLIVHGVRLTGRLTPGEIAVVLNKRATAELPERPYTILIVANPVLKKLNVIGDEGTAEYERDPILESPGIFRARVGLIISSLVKSSVLEPHLGKIRFLALFDPSKAEPERSTNGHDHEHDNDQVHTHHHEDELNKANALCYEIAAENIIRPLQANWARFCDVDYLKKHPALEHVDVIFAVSASRTHTESSSAFSVDELAPEAEEFILRHRDHQNMILWEKRGKYAPGTRIPGLVAYSAVDTSLITPIHEFAHAMSSTTNGAIVDEYDDSDLIKDQNLPANAIVINKRFATPEMDKNGDGRYQLSELPDLFAEYEDRKTAGHPLKFPTDKARQVSQDRQSFVPKRSNPNCACIMDHVDSDECEFDQLLLHFMHKRLEAKVS